MWIFGIRLGMVGKGYVWFMDMFLLMRRVVFVVKFDVFDVR